MKFMRSFLFLVFALVLACSHEPSAVASSAGNTALNPNIFVDLAKQVVPSVVNISTLSTPKGPQFSGRGNPEEFFRWFFGDRGGSMDPGEEGPPSAGPRKRQAMSLGTGFVIEEAGVILTNNHVVQGADEIKVHFTEDPNETPVDGEVIGRDPELDLALIKVKTKRKLQAVQFGDSDRLEVGEFVMAVGNPFGQGHSVTHGIISAKGRAAPGLLARYIQTDAPINPGNSGGPLVNLKGEVIGINNAIDARAQGIGFAIPVNLVKQVLPQLKSKGIVSRGYIGVGIADLNPAISEQLGLQKDAQGPFVEQVYPGDPAEKAGMKPYDLILEVDGKSVRNSMELVEAITSVPVGKKVKVLVQRGKKKETLTIHVTNRPGQERAERSSSPTKKKGKVEMGMTVEDLTPEIRRELGLPNDAQGVVVTDLAYGGPADSAGLYKGDLIVEVSRRAVTNVDGFYSVVREKKSYLLRVRRTLPQGGDSFKVIVLDLSDGDH